MSEAESERRRLRIVSGTPEEVEWHLNRMLDEYTVATWNFCPVGDHVIVTAVLLDNREIRKAQLAMTAVPSRMRN